jgi:hypothetical protein
MMMKTKNDLSFDEAKLDYRALIRTAEIAVSVLEQKIRQRLDKVRDSYSNRDITSLYLEAEWLSEDAERLSLCCETLSTLWGGVDRSNITIVNKEVTNE